MIVKAKIVELLPPKKAPKQREPRPSKYDTVTEPELLRQLGRVGGIEVVCEASKKVKLKGVTKSLKKRGLHDKFMAVERDGLVFVVRREKALHGEIG